MNTSFYLLLLGALLYSASCAPKLPKNNDPEDTYGPLNAEDEEDSDMQKDDNANVDYYDEKKDPEESSNAGSDKNEKKQEIYPPVKIETVEQVFKKDLNDVVLLPCKVSEPFDGVVVWYKDDKIIFHATVPMNAKKNHKLLDDHTLQISEIAEDDDGLYKCKAFVTEENRAIIVHTLKVKTPPRITDLHAKDNITTLSAGQELVLVCRATGYPVPQISWHKFSDKDELIRLGTTGDVLTVSGMNHKKSGKYLCFTDNHVGKPDQKYIKIAFTHKPIVHIDKIVVNSDQDMDTELRCTVHATPEASVSWKKDGVNIKSTNHTELQNDGNDHILILKGLRENDFGKYSCFAKNHLGKSEKHITLVKTPAVISFIKPEKTMGDVVLSWKVESKSPISEHELQYRKQGTENWQSVKPEVRNGDNGIYVIQHTLKELDAGTYETRVRSQNTHGWSDYSDITPFEGERGYHSESPAEQKDDQRVGAVRPSSSNCLTSQIFLISISLIVALYVSKS